MDNRFETLAKHAAELAAQVEENLETEIKSVSMCTVSYERPLKRARGSAKVGESANKHTLREAYAGITCPIDHSKLMLPPGATVPQYIHVAPQMSGEIKRISDALAACRDMVREDKMPPIVDAYCAAMEEIIVFLTAAVSRLGADTTTRTITKAFAQMCHDLPTDRTISAACYFRIHRRDYDKDAAIILDASQDKGNIVPDKDDVQMVGNMADGRTFRILRDNRGDSVAYKIRYVDEPPGTHHDWISPISTRNVFEHPFRVFSPSTNRVAYVLWLHAKDPNVGYLHWFYSDTGSYHSMVFSSPVSAQLGSTHGTFVVQWGIRGDKKTIVGFL